MPEYPSSMIAIEIAEAAAIVVLALLVRQLYNEMRKPENGNTG
jgi:hypothetical protein